MCRSQRSRLKSAWVKARAEPNIGPAAWRQAASCSSLTVFRLISRVKPCGSPLRNCRSRHVSFSALSNEGDATMKAKSRLSDLKVMSEDQLDQEVMNLKKEQFNLRFQRATGQLENTARVRVVRREIARAMTIAAQKRGAAK